MKTFLAAGAVAAALIAIPNAAHAEDQRPCVSNREFHSLHVVQSREALEERWEVVHLGRSRTTPMFGRVVAYPWCGHLMGQAWVGISYSRAGNSIGIVLYKANDDDPVEQAPDAPTGTPAVITCDVTCG